MTVLDYGQRFLAHLHKYLNEQKCSRGCEGTFAHTPYQELVSALRVEFRDTETSNDPPSTDVILFNDCTCKFHI